MWRKTSVFASFMCLSGQGRRAEGELGQGSGVCVPPVIARTIGGKLAAFLYYFFCLLGYVGGHLGSHFGAVRSHFGGSETQVVGEGRLGEALGRSGSPLEVVGEPSWAILGAL